MADNPNWKTFLNVIPEVLHSQVKPILEQWDQGVNAKLQSVRDEYKPYEAFKPFVEQSIDPNYVLQSVELADAIRERPADMVSRINQTYNLGFVPADQVQSGTDPDDEDYDLDDGDISKHPLVKKMAERLEQLEGKVTEDFTTRQQQTEAEQYAQYIQSLHDEHGDFDEIYVGSYLAAGFSPEDAIGKYQALLAQSLPSPGDENNNGQQHQVEDQSNNDPDNAPPVVLDGSGTGSGVEQPTVDWGAMKKSQVEDVALKFLQQAAEQ